MSGFLLLYTHGDEQTVLMMSNPIDKRSPEIHEVTTGTLRRRLGEVLDTAFRTGGEIRVTRKGRCLGVFVPIGLYEKRREVCRGAFLRFMDKQRATGRGDGFSDKEVMADAVAAEHGTD
jgi:prevent-host-death family protein